jgi:hypothetical protein
METVDYENIALNWCIFAGELHLSIDLEVQVKIV